MLGKTIGSALRKWKSRAQMIANPKLAKTPAEDTNSSPFRKEEKFKGLTGTGLAQASSGPGALPVKSAGIKIKAGKRIVPKRSI